MSKHIIDPNDSLHDSAERTLAGLSPKERANRLREMFDKLPSVEPDLEREKKYWV